MGLVETTDKALGELIASLGTEYFCTQLSTYVSKLLEYDNFIVLAYAPESTPQLLFSAISNVAVAESLHGPYLNGAYLLDPFFQAQNRKIKAGVYELLEVAPDHFTRTSYYKTHYQATEMVDELAAIAYIRDGVAITACFGNDTCSGTKFSISEKRRITRNQSTIVSLMRYHWETVGLPARSEDRSAHMSNSAFILEVVKTCGTNLTPRQAEVALQILQGHSSMSIGLNLNISIQTVKVFRKQIYKRCRVSSQAELFSLLMPILIETKK